MCVAAQLCWRKMPVQQFAEMVPTARMVQKSGRREGEQWGEAGKGKGAWKSFPGEEEGSETLF